MYHSMVLHIVTCRSARVCSTALWILGEYSTTVDEIQAAVEILKQSLGPTPFLSLEGKCVSRLIPVPSVMQALFTILRPAQLSSYCQHISWNKCA